MIKVNQYSCLAFKIQKTQQHACSFPLSHLQSHTTTQIVSVVVHRNLVCPAWHSWHLLLLWICAQTATKARLKHYEGTKFNLTEVILWLILSIIHTFSRRWNETKTIIQLGKKYWNVAYESDSEWRFLNKDKLLVILVADKNSWPTLDFRLWWHW